MRESHFTGFWANSSSTFAAQGWASPDSYRRIATITDFTGSFLFSHTCRQTSCSGHPKFFSILCSSSTCVMQQMNFIEAISAFSFSNLNSLRYMLALTMGCLTHRGKKFGGLHVCLLCCISGGRFNLEGTEEVLCRTSLHKTHWEWRDFVTLLSKSRW